MKILLLGAQGNLGGELYKTFKEGNDVIAWDKGEIDITDKELVFKKVADLKPDLIINAAAYNAVDKCEVDDNEFEIAKKINGEAPGFLAEAAVKIGAILVHYSTDYVFGGHAMKSGKTMKEVKAQGGFREDDDPRPVNKYGQSKLFGEQAILKFSGRGLKWYLIRTSKLFGPKGESEVAKPSFFDTMLKLSQEKKELNVVNEEKSCFTYTVDLAVATKNIIDNDLGYGIYHIANEHPDTWYQAVKELFKLAQADIQVNPITAADMPRPAKRPSYSVLINTKFVPPLRDYREALKDYLINSRKP